jgi:hypothetical protein
MSPKLEALADALAPLIAERVAEELTDLLADQAGADASLIDATEVAKRYGVTRYYVYAHAAELGAVRMGDGPRARLRFDPARVAEALDAPTHKPKPRSNGAQRTARPEVELLPIREAPR